jgi:hypothetical protein
MFRAAVLSVLLAAGVVRSQAATFWVENFTLSLNAARSDGNVGSINTKTVINLLTNLSYTDYNTIVGTNVVTTSITNFVPVTNNILVTNFFALNNLTNGHGYVLEDYTVTDTNNVSYTNHIQFTNDIVFLISTTNPITTTFNNAVTISSTQTLYLVTNLAARTVKAELTTNDPGNVFSLTGTVQTQTNFVRTTTNYTYKLVTTPTSFTSGAKLQRVTQLDAFGAPVKYYVTDQGGKRQTDVSTYFTDTTTYESVTRRNGMVATYWTIREIDFDNNKNTGGSKLIIVGSELETTGGQLVGKQMIPGVSKSVMASAGGWGNYTADDNVSYRLVFKGSYLVGGGKVVIQ